MSKINVAPLTTDAFSARAICRERTATVFLRGEADLSVQAALRGFIRSLHAEACRERLVELVVDVRDLEFMTSSCFKELVTWANELQSLPADERYRVRFLSSPSSHWQKRSLLALSRFANDVIVVD